MSYSNTLIKYLRKPHLFTITIAWMVFLVFFGTLAQKDMGLFAVQNRYFSSWFIWFFFLPFPGGRLTMLLMFINLLFFVSTKTLWKKDKFGLLILHLGGLLLMVGGGLTAMFSYEGNIVIDEGGRSNYIEDYYYMELALIEISDPIYDNLTVFDSQLLRPNSMIRHHSIPFEIEVLNYIQNCEVFQRKSLPALQYRGMLKNFILSDLNPEKEANRNRPGIILNISNTGTANDGIYGLFLGQSVPQTITLKDKEYLLVFRKKRTYLPFQIELIDFKKEMHPGTDIAKSYSSDINLIDLGIAKKILIEMNQPLRYKGYTFYQSSFIESLDGETTVLAAVKNYGRLFPYISTIIMCLGLLIHLLFKLPKLFNRI